MQQEVVSREGVPNRRYFRTPATAPGPSGPQMLRAIRTIRTDALGFLEQMAREYGPVVQFPIPSPPSYLVSDPEAVRRVLVTKAKDYDKETIQYRSLSLVTGEGLLTTSGDVWRRQRRMVQPAFHHQVLEGVVGHAARGAEDLLARWGDAARQGRLRRPAGPERGAVIDVDEAMMRVALETVGASLFGTDLSADADRLARATIEALDVVVARAQVPVQPPQWLPTRRTRALRAALAQLDDAVASMISSRQRGRGADEPATLLDLLVDASIADPPIPVSEVRDELVAFLVAGHETTASALTWVLWLLAGDLDIQAEVARELGDVLGDRGPSYADLDRLPWTRAVFDEAMRLYPPVWLVSRQAREGDVLAGREIPAGSLIIMTPYIAQRDPMLWDEPADFHPRRFLDGHRRGATGDAVFWPFGLGPRMCIGRDFAYVEGMTVLAVLLRQLEFTRLPGVTPRPAALVTLRPADPLPLVVTRRA
ncbi:MAG: cytochrome P450 [Candidatus Nanopelagicales bacterium]